MHHRAQNFIAELFREQGRIKTKHRQQNFIAELFRRHGQTMFNGGRQTRMNYYEKKDAGNEVKYDVPNFNLSNVLMRKKQS